MLGGILFMHLILLKLYREFSLSNLIERTLYISGGRMSCGLLDFSLNQNIFSIEKILYLYSF